MIWIFGISAAGKHTLIQAVVDDPKHPLRRTWGIRDPVPVVVPGRGTTGLDRPAQRELRRPRVSGVSAPSGQRGGPQWWYSGSAAALGSVWQGGRPVKVSVSVMAHPTRADQVKTLLKTLGDVPVSWDPNPHPSADPRRRWATGRAAWEMHDPEADWHVVIQDDALVSRDLVPALEKHLTNIPETAVVSLYLGMKKPAQEYYLAMIDAAKLQKASWIVSKSLSWGVGIAVPTWTIPRMLEWCSRTEKASLAYDKRIGQYYRDQLRWACWHPWPSLADHRQGPSICGHETDGRRAFRFHAGSALSLNLSGKAVFDQRLKGRRFVGVSYGQRRSA